MGSTSFALLIVSMKISCDCIEREAVLLMSEFAFRPHEKLVVTQKRNAVDL